MNGVNLNEICMISPSTLTGRKRAEEAVSMGGRQSLLLVAVAAASDNYK